MSKKLLFGFIAILLFCGLAFSKVMKFDPRASDKAKTPPASEISWIMGLDAGLAKAEKDGKPMMVDFFADWCSWCKKLDKEVYTDPAVIESARDFVNVKVDVDNMRDDAKQYGVTGLPTIVFMDKEGNVIKKVVGYNDKAAFLKIMKEVAQK